MEVRHQVSAESIEDSYPLSPMQQGMLFNSLSDPGSGVDIEQLLFELHEALDVAAFQRAWRCVIARHPVLRTSLHWENLSAPRQDVHAQVDLPWEEQDQTAVERSERSKCLENVLKADRHRGFELTRAPLFRLTLLRFGEADFCLIWTFHHTVLEGRSFALVIREAFAFYEALRQGNNLSLPRPRPYRDYIEWLQQQDFNKDESFWRETLKGFTAPTPLVTERAPATRDDCEDSKGTQEILLSAEFTSALRALAQANQVTLNTIVQAAWAILLSRYSGEEDVVFGVIRANRRSTIEGAESMVGLFLNTLPLRVRVNPQAALLPWLREVRQVWLAMRGHQHAPLARIQAWSDVNKGSPLFQSTMMFENYHLDTVLRQQGGPWSNRRFRLFLQTNYPLDLAAYDGSELRLRIDFDRSQINDAAAGRMIGQLRMLLEAAAIDPHRTVGELPLLNSAECHQLLVAWNRTAAEFPPDVCIHELFETQVQRTPEATAVTSEHQQLTYQELNRRSNQLARHLRSLGVGPDVLVCICAQRSLEMVVGMLAVLKAGGAYVPIDASYPAEQIAFMMNDARAPVVLAQESLIPALPTATTSSVVSLDGSNRTTVAADRANPPRIATDKNLAYVIYTSGSTGLPKGVMIPHRAIVNHLRWMQSTFPMDERDCVLQKTEFSFDVSVWEIFAPLICGARLVMARPGGHQDPAYLVDSIREHQVTVLQLVPSLLRVLLETPELGKCDCLRHVFCGGEAMTEDIPRRFFGVLSASLHNMYGPTEVAIDAAFYSVPRDSFRQSVPIGRPIANMRAYVLDRLRQPVPIGVPGELYLGGVQVGRGYLNKPQLTAECFIPDPFTNESGARIFKTGDKVRFLEDGNIAFLGRTDQQVKIRGFRVELEGIESALKRHPAVDEAVVLMHEFAPGDSRLVAYVARKNSPPASGRELRRFLEQQLPAHMIPSGIVFVAALPRTPNGKVDRNALPPPEKTSLISDEVHAAPRTPIEEELAAAWREVLNLEHVGVDDNFFELGGHSLMLFRLISNINAKLSLNFSVGDLLRNPTVAQMAELVDGRQPQRAQRSAVVHLRDGRGELPVYFIYAGPSESRIAQHMDGSHAVFGIEARWPLEWRNALAENREPAIPSMEEFVAPYVAALSAHAQSSPCVLAGFSFAGLIAFEAARQVEMRGGKVELVVLVDTQARPPNPYRHAWQVWQQSWKPRQSGGTADWGMPSIVQRMGQVWRTSWWLLGRVRKKFMSILKHPVTDSSTLTAFVDEQGMLMPWGLVDRLFRRIEATYDLRRIDTRGLLLRTAELDGQKALRADSDSLGWDGLFTHGLEIVTIPGGHFSIFNERTPTIAREMNRAIRQRSIPSDNKAGAGESSA